MIGGEIAENLCLGFGCRGRAFLQRSQIIKFTNGRVTNRQGRPGRFKKEIMRID